MRGWTLGLGCASCFVAGILASCSTGTDCDFKMCAFASTTDGGDVDSSGNGDGGVPEASTPADCKEDADAISPEAKGCVVDNFAVFVNGDGGDNASDGSKAKPLKTISAAITKAGATGKRRIYVCGSAAFAEHVTLKSAISLYGGFSCATWEPDAGAKAKVAPSDKGYALLVDGVSAHVTVSDLEFVAPNAGALSDGTSSIAVFVNQSDVAFVRAALRGGNGATGAKGDIGKSGEITAVSSGSPSSPEGNPASGTTGGLFKECTCSSGLKTRGGGGTNAGSGTGGNGEPSYGGGLGTNGAGGGAGQTCSPGQGSGAMGANATPAANALAPAHAGVLSGDGWKPSGGDDATESGRPGQGGGGGGGDTTHGGSGGGCGGCGGLPGKGSGGGGASIGLLVKDSAVRVSASVIEAKTAGAGGIAGAGGAPSAAGSPGTPGLCPGGSGGAGATGGAGAGGAGGVAIGILYAGTKPDVDAATTFTRGTLGAAGKGGSTSPANDGPPGIAEDMKDATQL